MFLFSLFTLRSEEWSPIYNFVGLNPSPLLGATCIQRRAIGKILLHFRCVSWHSLPRVFFRVWFIFSAFPVDWSLHAEWSFHFIPKVLFTVCLMSAMKADPLSLWIVEGRPYLGIMSLRRAFVTSDAFSVLVGKASTQTWTRCNPLKSLAKISLKRVGEFLNPCGILSLTYLRKFNFTVRMCLKSHPQWSPSLTIITPFWLPLLNVKADVKCMSKRSQNRLLF